ncbi:MAG TPA: hypothetical protein VF779_02295 [Pyrinomonadaceae bacterium]
MKVLLTNSDSTEDAGRRINELIEAHSEWLCVSGARATLLRNSECDFRVERGRLIFSCLGEEGWLIWRITGWDWTGEKLLLEASRRMGAERGQLELVPRASIKAMTALVSATRRERCRQLAELASDSLKGARIERASFSAGSRPGQAGALARIILRRKNERIAVAGFVVESTGRNIDAFLSSTLLWFARISERTRPPFISQLWLIVESDLIESLAQRLALLRDEMRSTIALYRIGKGEISSSKKTIGAGLVPDRALPNTSGQGQALLLQSSFTREVSFSILSRKELPELTELLTKKRERLKHPVGKSLLSESAERIVALAPEAIDVVRSRHGETLRFHGLAFARVRHLLNRERVWFGIESARRRVLDETTENEWTKLLNDLRAHRNECAVDQNNALYRAAPEAWLESKLRRDIIRLDPGLRLAPLYAQFRPARANGARPIDLLALRQDGRLAVIELKVSEDREHVLQGAAYWLEVEAHRRAGNIARARLFGEATIADEPALVYLVAPLLRFHRAFEILARQVSKEIDIYRFDINEDWRAGVKVLRRCDFNQ